MTAEKAIVIRPPSEVAPFDEIQAQAKQLDNFYRSLMSKGTDYDTIPGTPKPTLLKPGAELLRLWAGLSPEFDIDSTGTDLVAGIYHYQVRCTLCRENLLIAEGVGSCNSLESKYRWRWVFASQLPPDAKKESLVKRWVKGSQGGDIPQYRMDNENPHDQANTILKMAKKRAFVDAILTATGASRIFTQDLEDAEPTQLKSLTEEEPPIEGEYHEEPEEAPAPKPSPPRATTAKTTGTKPKATEKRDKTYIDTDGVRRCNLLLKNSNVCGAVVKEVQGQWGPWWSCPSYKEHA